MISDVGLVRLVRLARDFAEADVEFELITSSLTLCLAMVAAL